MAVHAILAGVPLGRSAALTRGMLGDRPAVRQQLSSLCNEALAIVQPSLHRAVRCWSGREQGLLEGLRHRHARLSAALLQRALFDRQDERAAAAQTALLDKALSQCADRLAELGGCRHIGVDACDLVFAVIRE